MQLPSWFLGYLGLTVALHLSAFFLCDIGLTSTEDNEGNPFTFIVNHATFQSCTETPAWLNWSLFMFATLPLLLVGAVLVLPLAQGLLANPIAGTIAGLGAVGLIVKFIWF